MSDEGMIVDTSAAKAARKAEQVRDGQNAMREYQEEFKRAQEKTERLRALRLAKEVDNRATTKPKAKKVKTPKE
jgi:hypothetical protein